MVEEPFVARELRVENERLGHLHALLAAELHDVSSRARQAAMAPTEAGDSSRWERDTATAGWADRAAQLRAARSGLCFGRLDHATGRPSYVGRVGLTEAAGTTALVDWRAPAARLFYCATAAVPEGITRRRHLRLTGSAPDERVVAFHDDVLDRRSAGSADGSADPALLAALAAPRGSVMRDIVGTIQAEQDAIIRLPMAGTLVVEGGPGTGKTAVALHRVAYLLYTHRDQLARRGVLVVGPHEAFLRYVAEVVPALGETAVVFTTPGRLRHGVDTAATDVAEVARTKGAVAIVDVLEAAVRQRQVLPEKPIEIVIDDVTLTVDATVAGQARARARATGLPHNEARAVFRDAVGARLVRQAVLDVGASWLDPADIRKEPALSLAAEVRFELVRNLDFHAAVEELWPLCTPERLLSELLSDADRLAELDPDLVALHRADGAAWTVCDAPLLDELVEILGPVPGGPDAPPPDVDYAAGVLEIIDRGGADEMGEELLQAADLLDADALADRQVEVDGRSVAERAAADRDWTYGHLVVDEAQELSPMDWRVLARRCPTRSVTAVGDLAQRSAAAGARTWADVLGGRWTRRAMTVNYRTPAEIMEVAAAVLPDVGPGLRAPESVRSTGEHPWERRVTAAELPGELRRALAALPDRAGTVAVIAPDPTALPGMPVPVLAPAAAKGLEFDDVIVVDPDAIRAACPADLYVALTRATRSLGVLRVE